MLLRDLRGPAEIATEAHLLTRISLPVGAADREYLFFAPPAGPVPPPLVVVLHGAGGTAAWADGETGWSAAARAGFALALPDALPPDPTQPPKFLTNPPLWNTRGAGADEDLLDGSSAAADDLAFLSAVLTDAATRAGADPRRVSVTGFSNGAAMAFRVAAELSDRVAAVAPVAGYCRVPAGFRPARPVPTLYLIGAADPLVPVRGGEVRSPWKHRLVRRRPVAGTLARWAGILGCAPDPVAAADADGVRVDVYPGPVPFRAVTIDGLGHHWPGGKGQLNHRIAGPPSARVDGVAAVWEFCRPFAL
ncbi:MAG TPA: dienelactone hydrolase family protein [Urbifossiella sp.]|nr:dienelactone hydrolase family protein [Urbifossiella sp.]